MSAGSAGVQAARGGLGHDRLAERVLAEQLGASGGGQQLVAGDARGEPQHRDGRASRGERAGLVEDDGVDRRQVLQVHAALGEGAGARHAGHRGEDGQGSAGRDAAGPGDDDDRDGDAQVAGDQPGEHRAAQGDVDEVAGQPVGQPLRGGRVLLGGADRLDDAPVRGVGAHVLGLDLEHPELVHRAGVDPVSGGEFDGQRLPGDPRLVDTRTPRDDQAVDRDRTAGRHDDDLALVHLGQPHLGQAVGGAHLHLVGQEGHEIGQGVPASVHRQVLEDLGREDEHGDEQRRQPLTDGGGRDDRDEHRQLHAHPTATKVLDGFDDDRPAADDDADRGDQRQPGAGPVQAERQGDRAGQDEQGPGRVGPVHAAQQGLGVRCGPGTGGRGDAILHTHGGAASWTIGQGLAP